MKNISTYITIVFMAFVMVLLNGCKEDSSEVGREDGTMVKVVGTISTRTADGVLWEAENDHELINDWWVVLVNRSSGVIDRIITRPVGRPAVEIEQFEMDMLSGDYIAYTFANISQATVEALPGVGTLTIGGTMPDMSGVTYNLVDYINNGTGVLGNTKHIPMTGKQDVRLSSSGIQFIDLEVIRMIAKLEFDFTNESSKDITINSLKMMEPIGKYVPLLPNYEYLEYGIPDVAYSDVGVDVLKGVTPTGENLVADGGKYTITFGSNKGGEWESQFVYATSVATELSDIFDLSLTIKTSHNQKVRIKVEENSNGSNYYLEPQYDFVAGVSQTLSFPALTDRRMVNGIRFIVALGQGALAGESVEISNISFKKRLANTMTRNFEGGSGKLLRAGNVDPVYKDYFYMRESKADYNLTNRYLMTVNATRDGMSTEYMFALTKNLSYIYRNDYIVVPIVFSDYKVDLEVNFYPPIGGYPAVITDRSEEEFFCEFGTQGDFKISPVVKDYTKGLTLVYQDGPSTNATFDYVITDVSDPDHIFARTPAIESGTGEILGELNTNQGIAYVDVRVFVHPPSSGVDQVYDRRIHIIRK